ncbi:MAG: hypothetical protein QOE48_6438 [Mycobacterium sp.]|jgi:hypothetical protein|nr:hypothetical protein [Mycobacterium sp.]
MGQHQEVSADAAADGSKKRVQHHAIRSGMTSTKYPSCAVVTTFDPRPAGFDPLTADPEPLWRHGFPDRPSDPATLRRWQALLGKPLRFVKATNSHDHSS